MFHPVSCMRTPFESSFFHCQAVIDKVIWGITESNFSGHYMEENYFSLFTNYD